MQACECKLSYNLAHKFKSYAHVVLFTPNAIELQMHYPSTPKGIACLGVGMQGLVWINRSAKVVYMELYILELGIHKFNPILPFPLLESNYYVEWNLDDINELVDEIKMEDHEKEEVHNKIENSHAI